MMRHFIRFLSAVIVAACLCHGVAAAQAEPSETNLILQKPRGRLGYYISMGLGGGYRYFWVDGAHDPSGSAVAFTQRFGQMVTEHLGLGLRIGANFGSQLAMLGLEGQWEFAENFALRAGLGLGIASVDKDKNDPDAKQKGTVGGGYSLGVSYDWFLFELRSSGGFALTPIVEARFVPGSELSAVTAFVGIGITYWTGLPRRQLLLPEHEAYRRQR